MLDPAPSSKVPVIQKTIPRNRLAIGPAIAIRNSPRGVFGSFSISATPPKIKSVIPDIGISYLRATSEWENSWKIIEKNSPKAPRRPMVQ